jgi:hypothetical protein
MPIGDFYDVTWGSVRLWCSSITTDNSRTQVVHELAEGDDHPVQDRGLAPRRVQCSLLFVEMPSEQTSALDRLLSFKAQVDDGEIRLFTHPIDGGYYANVEAFSYTLDEDGNCSDASCTFIKSAVAEGPVPAGSGTTAVAGEESVAARSAAFDAAIDAVNIESTIGDDAIAATEAWSSVDIVPTRQVIVDVAGLSTALSTLIEVEGLENDLKLFEAYKASIFLGASIRAAALAALAETPKLTAIRIAESISVWALCRRIYGGAETEVRSRQVLALNDIRTPGWIATGSVVTIPVPTRSTTPTRRVV